MGDKDELLGMSFGAACNRLRKAVLFREIKLSCRNLCYRCGEEIKDVDELSIEHKNSWQNAVDPVSSFFDLDNVAFSHTSCNYAAKKHWNKGSKTAHGTLSRYKAHSCRCDECRASNNEYSRSWDKRHGRTTHIKPRRVAGGR